MAANLRLFDRVVIAQRNTGNILDIDAIEIGADIGRTRDRPTKMMGDASLWPQTSTNTLEVPLLEDTHERMAFIMEEQGCECIAIALGEQHIGFFEGARPLVRPQNAPAGEIAPKVLQLTTGTKYADVMDSRDLIRAVPWEGATTETGSVSGTGLIYDLMPDHRWSGRAWGTGSSSIAPGVTGAAPNVDSTNYVRLEFPLPLWGADIRIEFPDSHTDNVNSFVQPADWSGSFISAHSFGTTFTVPTKTWELQIQMEDAPAYPQLLVEDPGDAWGVLEGAVLSDCSSRVGSPHWNETAVDLTADNI